MTWNLEPAYREHLTSGDLALLAGALDGRSLTSVLSSPDLERVVFGSDPAVDPHRMASPFLTFAVAIHRVEEGLAGAAYIDEWIGPRQWVPVFAVEPLRELLADPLRRFYFAELLASYTHVTSGSVWTATRRGWRRRRFSELRRLGDLALFLTGVFPDHTATTSLGRPLSEVQLLRSAGFQPSQMPPGSTNPLHLLELLGARWYRLAVELAPAPSGSVEALAVIADYFADARRILNVVTDSYLFPLREQWFGRPAA